MELSEPVTLPGKHEPVTITGGSGTQSSHLLDLCVPAGEDGAGHLASQSPLCGVCPNNYSRLPKPSRSIHSLVTCCELIVCSGTHPCGTLAVHRVVHGLSKDASGQTECRVTKLGGSCII